MSQSLQSLIIYLPAIAKAAEEFLERYRRIEAQDPELWKELQQGNLDSQQRLEDAVAQAGKAS